MGTVLERCERQFNICLEVWLFFQNWFEIILQYILTVASLLTIAMATPLRQSRDSQSFGQPMRQTLTPLPISPSTQQTPQSNNAHRGIWQGPTLQTWTTYLKMAEYVCEISQHIYAHLQLVLCISIENHYQMKAFRKKGFSQNAVIAGQKCGILGQKLKSARFSQ